MKKVMFFLAILFATASFAQFSGKEMILNPGETGKVITNPCPNELGKIFPIKDETHYPVEKELPTTKQKKGPRTYIPVKKDAGISNSFNITTTNHYYPTPLRNPAENNKYFYGDSWLVPLLLALIFLGLIFALIYFNNKNQNPANLKPITIQPAPAPPAPRPAVIIPVSEKELKEAMDKAEASGAGFMRHKDGSYSIDFPKPPTSAQEKKPEEKKEGAIDLTKKDEKNSSSGGGTVMG